MIKLSRNCTYQSPFANVMIRRGQSTICLQAHQDHLQKPLIDLSYTSLADPNTKALNAIAKALLCGRVLKPYGHTPDTYELAHYCRQYHLCPSCSYHRSRAFARPRTHSSQGILGLRCFDTVIHFDPLSNLHHSSLALDHAARLRSQLVKSLANSWLNPYVADYVFGIHLKQTPHSAVMQPHLHGVLLITDDVTVRQVHDSFESWIKSLTRLYLDPLSPSDYIDLAPRSSPLTHRGIVVARVDPNRPSKRKRISAAHVRHLLAYAVRTTELEDAFDHRITRHSLLAESNIHTFSARKLRTGKSNGPSHFASTLPVIVIPFNDRPRLVPSEYRKNVELALKADALSLLDRIASGKSFNPYKIPSTISEFDLLPEHIYPEQASALACAS